MISIDSKVVSITEPRVMMRVMKRYHHPDTANAAISTEIKRSSPPRLLPQAEGNFRQQVYEQ